MRKVSQILDGELFVYDGVVYVLFAGSASAVVARGVAEFEDDRCVLRSTDYVEFDPDSLVLPLSLDLVRTAESERCRRAALN